MNENLSGWKFVAAPGKVVGLVEFKGQIIVACENAVYRLVGESLHPIHFMSSDDVAAQHTIDRHDSDCATHNMPAYPNGPCNCSLSNTTNLTQDQRKALAICRKSGRVSVSEVQRKMAIGFNAAQVICQSVVELGVVDGMELAPTLRKKAV